MTMKTLWCKAGEHNWERPSQRGRVPHNCPDHTPEKATAASREDALDKARAIRASKRAEEEKAWAERIKEVIDDPRMRSNNPNSYADARANTVSKLLYIQEQLTSRRDRPQNELADLEKMREKIMKDPFNSTGHLL